MFSTRANIRRILPALARTKVDVSRFDPWFPSNYAAVPEKDVEPIQIRNDRRDTEIVTDWWDVVVAKFKEHKMGEWKTAAPLAITFAVCAYHMGLVSFSHHDVGTAFTWLACAGLVRMFLPDITKANQEEVAEDLMHIRTGEANRLATIRNVMSFLDDVTLLHDHAVASNEKVDRLIVDYNKSLNIQVQSQLNNLVSTKLRTISDLESNLLFRLKDQVIEETMTRTMATIQTDKKVKENALNHALAVLSNHTAKRGRDIVGELALSKLTQVKSEMTTETIEGNPLVKDFRVKVGVIMADAKFADPPVYKLAA